MKKRSMCILMSLVLCLSLVVDMTPVEAAEVSSDKLFDTGDSEIERGITVLPSGDIYAITKDADGEFLTGFREDGTRNGNRVKAPSKYCGNLCSTKDGVIFSHSYNRELYIYNPAKDSSVRTVNTSIAIQSLECDTKGNLYAIVKNVKAAKIYKVAASKIANLESGKTFSWDAEYSPKYSSGDYFPCGLDVDNNGNAFIVDKGSYSGSDSAVHGIYKYNFKTGKISMLYFTDIETIGDNSLRGVTVDDYGNVSVLSNGSKCIYVFRPGDTVASQIINYLGYVDDLDSDANGNVVYASYGNMNTGNAVFRCNLKNVSASGLTLSASSKSIVAGKSFSLRATITPSNATNKVVTFASSNTKVATVNAAGKVTGINAGTAVITAISAQGGYKKSCTVKVSVAKPSKVKLLSAKNQTKKTAKITWKKTKNARYYQVKYKKKGGSFKYLSKKTTATSIKKKSLKKGKTYYFKVRAVSFGSKPKYGKWSATKSVKIKR